MRPAPIFDTNVFIDASRGLIPASSWDLLKHKRPRRGWSLSAITAMELLVGINRVSEEKFETQRKAVALAYELCAGRILNEPRILICDKVLKREFPEGNISMGPLLSNYLLIASRATEKSEILGGRVFIKRLSRRGVRRGGFDPQVIDNLMSGPKNESIAIINRLLDGISPSWRQRIGLGKPHLPEEHRAGLESAVTWEQKRQEFLNAFGNWLSPGITDEELGRLDSKIDAALTFAVSILREVLLGNYAFAKKPSDFYDLLQLHYLALDRYVFVTRDVRLKKRLQGSSQLDRVLEFEAFLATL